MKYAHIVGWGNYLPDRIMHNDEVAEMVNTTHEWIYTRTGIAERRIATENETTATMAFKAAARALAIADMHPNDIDLIIVATSTPDYMFPSTASLVQDYLGSRNAGAFDLSAACSGFVYALTMAAQSIATDTIQNALVIGAETMSRVLDWEDRKTCILFGDGAGAVVLKGSPLPGGMVSSTLRSDGSGGNLLTLPSIYHNPVPGLDPKLLRNGFEKNTIDMNGRQVFRFATRVIAESIEHVVEKAGLKMENVDLIVPHQANVRIIQTAAKRLSIPVEKFYVNVERTGNTSAASIPIALCQAIDAGRVHKGDNIIFVGFGGGLTWGTTLLQWNTDPPEKMAFVDREWQQFRYRMARRRSQARQLYRRMQAFVGGSPTPDASLKDATKRDE